MYGKDSPDLRRRRRERRATDEFTDERADLLNAVYNLACLIDQTKDPAKISEYVDQLNKLKSKLIAIGSAKKAAGQS